MAEEIRIVHFDDSKQREWDHFVDNSNNGTIFHKIKFLRYHKADKFKFNHLMFYFKGRLVAVLPAGMVGDKQLRSPVGASFGSFATEDLSLSEHNLIIKTFLEFCSKSDIKEVYFTPEPVIYQKVRNDNITFSLLYNGFVYTNHLFSSVLDLRNRQKKPLELLLKRTQWSVKKSFEKNIVVKESDNFEEFYPILLKNKLKFGIKPAHTLEELCDLKSRFPGDIRLFMAYLPDGTPAAGNVIFICNKKSILLFYSAHLYEYKEYNAINRLMYNVILFSREHDFDYLDLGVSMNTASDNPMEPQWNLVFFKEGIGSKGLLRSTLYKRI